MNAENEQLNVIYAKQMVLKLLRGTQEKQFIVWIILWKFKIFDNTSWLTLYSYALKMVVELLLSSKLLKHCRAYGHYGATDKIVDQRPRKLNTAAVWNCYFFANIPLWNRKKSQYLKIHVYIYH